MLPLLIQTDLSITAFIFNTIPRNPLFDSFFSFLSLQGISVIFWILLMGYLILKEEKKEKKFILYFLLIIGFSYLFSDFFLKNIFHRTRPLFDTTIAHLYYCPRDYSFPSTHALLAFTACGILDYVDKKRMWIYYLVASLIAFSRIYLGCHYVLDVIAGASIGLFISYISIYLLLSPLHSPRRRPRSK
ncbi:MAG: phosphatase PAP2 family protein [bacterium]|nr:phosphatase PAP2 family protein [bacterium]